MLDFLTGLRDGGSSPDLFYLGQLPDRAGRFCARLDALHTIEAPEAEGPRKDFLGERRVGALSRDFARDLHLRVFGAFASLGFDDNRWSSTEDLEWLVTRGQADLAAGQQAVLEQEALRASRSAEGAQFHEADLANAQRRLEELRDRIAPYAEELAQRRARAP